MPEWSILSFGLKPSECSLIHYDCVTLTSPVDENVHVVLEDFLHFRFHFLFLCQFQLGHLGDCVDPHSSTKDLTSNNVKTASHVTEHK